MVWSYAFLFRNPHGPTYKKSTLKEHFPIFKTCGSGLPIKHLFSHMASRKHTNIILTPLNPNFI